MILYILPQRGRAIYNSDYIIEVRQRDFYHMKN